MPSFRLRSVLPVLLACLLAVAGRPARAGLVDAAGMGGLAPGAACQAAIAAAERGRALPPGLLGAIALVESGRRDPITGALTPWPWSINVEGEGHVYETEAAAIAAVRAFQAQGHRSIDVGCLQVNLMHHPDAFADLAAAFDPMTNAAYAADLLQRLHDPAQGWLAAAGLYHSATPGIAAPYRARVAQLMNGGPESGQAMRLAANWSRGGPDGLDGGAAAAAAGRLSGLPPAGNPAMVLRAMGGPPPPRASGFTGRALSAYRASPVMRRG